VRAAGWAAGVGWVGWAADWGAAAAPCTPRQYTAACGTVVTTAAAVVPNQGGLEMAAGQGLPTPTHIRAQRGACAATTLLVAVCIAPPCLAPRPTHIPGGHTALPDNAGHATASASAVLKGCTQQRQQQQHGCAYSDSPWQGLQAWKTTALQGWQEHGCFEDAACLHAQVSEREWGHRGARKREAPGSSMLHSANAAVHARGRPRGQAATCCRGAAGQAAGGQGAAPTTSVSLPSLMPLAHDGASRHMPLVQTLLMQSSGAGW
jgi:hypothetical protein